MQQSSTERIAKMLENDVSGGVRTALRVAQSDVMSALCEFMDVTKLDMTADKTAEGYAVNIRAEVSRFYGVGNTSETD